ncbi:chromosomal replication initiator protein DnaA [Eikenella sp. S3360]|uniref:Chromosomal replication initiator protein DnaA n=1 Tax=Eikenella glucosivorans TaxID=2766967 RepID=A0ABS0N7N9_9NEIS|nr:chromosomal replication initiator protein DnaA [Eikenella glucosivorans]MBH5328327.1 chromosomal replication initiator protein DnaA [Eikenella glucosivorans]
MTLEQFWPYCLHHLRHTLPAKQYQSWIAPLSVGERADGGWVVYAPSRFVLNMLRTHYAGEIRSLLQQRLPENTPELVFQQGQGKQYAPASEPWPDNTTRQPAPKSDATSVKTSPKKAKKTSAQAAPIDKRTALEMVQARLESLGIAPQPEPAHTEAALPVSAQPAPAKPAEQRSEQQKQRYAQTNLSSEYTFDTLVEGKGNRLAVAAARSIAENPGKNYNPFFLYGSTGLGKTHLAQAVGNELLRLKPDAKIYYMHAEDFVRGMIQAFRNHAHDAFRQQYKPYDFLIIDDIQFIKGKDRSMEEFFHLYNHCHHHKKQIILTCDVLPTKIDDMDDRLKSRFSWGLTVELEPPELEMRVEILQKKAESLGVELKEDAAFFIATHVRSNVRELEGAFKRVEARSRFLAKPIDVELATEALQDIVVGNFKPINLPLIMDTVAKYYGIRTADLIGKKRAQSIVRPRHLAIKLARELTSYSYEDIGKAFGGRDHSTVLNSVKKADELRNADAEIAQDYEKLLIIIKN